MFQFEGGLFVTAAVVDGAYQLASKLGKAPTISQVSGFMRVWLHSVIIRLLVILLLWIASDVMSFRPIH